MTDFFNLKKADDSLRDLDAKLSKVFKPEPRPDKRNHYSNKNNKSQNRKLIDKKDAETIKAIAKGTNDTITKLYKYATKNKIPKDYQGIMDMKDRLELEKKQRLEMIEAKKVIQELQKERKEEIKSERRQKIIRLKLLAKKITGR